MSEPVKLPSWDETVPVGTINTAEADVPSDCITIFIFNVRLLFEKFYKDLYIYPRYPS